MNPLTLKKLANLYLKEVEENLLTRRKATFREITLWDFVYCREPVDINYYHPSEAFWSMREYLMVNKGWIQLKTAIQKESIYYPPHLDTEFKRKVYIKAHE